MTLSVSKKATHLIGSEIIKLAGEVNEKIKQGKKIYNFTIGDFDPAIFPIPEYLEKLIIEEYQLKQTNYPPADGVLELRQAVSSFLQSKGNLNYSPNEILISGGARPLIYAIYQTLIDPGEKVLFPIPSWNNNHYAYLSDAQCVEIETTAENNFMPTAEEIEPHVQDVALIALCSPLNPTGTVFSADALKKICDLIINENKRRGNKQKPLYLMYDQIYWLLTSSEIQHVDPVSLCPEMKSFTIYVDGISKGFAATGVRVGWTFGPETVIQKMKSLLGHIGAWAPKPEQLATARFLMNPSAVEEYLQHIKFEIQHRLSHFYSGFIQLKKEGFRVDAIQPQGAIYLTIQFNLRGMKTAEGQILEKTEDITSYLLNEAGFAIVPFYAFGSQRESSWYRLSVGTSKKEEIDEVIQQIKTALIKLS
jgi:aspartate aminotransferase